MRLGVHALVSAALIDVRLPGLVLPALTLAGLALEVLARRVTLRRALALSPLYLALTAGAGLLAWPALWPDPLDGFTQAWEMMSHFPHESGMLFMGQNITTLTCTLALHPGMAGGHHAAALSGILFALGWPVVAGRQQRRA